MVTVSVAKWCARARQMLRTRYVRLLEDELARARGEVARQRDENERLRQELAAVAARADDEMAALRAENRAVINSLLGTAGVPPIETPRAFIPTPPVRRRSWPQIATTREIEAARAEKKQEREKQASAPEPFESRPGFAERKADLLTAQKHTSTSAVSMWRPTRR